MHRGERALRAHGTGSTEDEIQLKAVLIILQLCETEGVYRYDVAISVYMVVHVTSMAVQH